MLCGHAFSVAVNRITYHAVSTAFALAAMCSRWDRVPALCGNVDCTENSSFGTGRASTGRAGGAAGIAPQAQLLPGGARRHNSHSLQESPGIPSFCGMVAPAACMLHAFLLTKVGSLLKRSASHP